MTAANSVLGNLPLAAVVLRGTFGLATLVAADLVAAFLQVLFWLEPSWELREQLLFL